MSTQLEWMGPTRPGRYEHLSLINNLSGRTRPHTVHAHTLCLGLIIYSICLYVFMCEQSATIKLAIEQLKRLRMKHWNCLKYCRLLCDQIGFLPKGSFPLFCCQKCFSQFVSVAHLKLEIERSVVNVYKRFNCRLYWTMIMITLAMSWQDGPMSFTRVSVHVPRRVLTLSLTLCRIIQFTRTSTNLFWFRV